MSAPPSVPHTSSGVSTALSNEDFALICTRDPGLFKHDDLLIKAPYPGGMGNGAKRIRNSPFNLVMMARGGAYGLDTVMSSDDEAGELPYPLYYFCPEPPWEGYRTMSPEAGIVGSQPWQIGGGIQVNTPGGNVNGAFLAGISQSYLCLRLIPAPPSPEIAIRSETSALPQILASRGAGSALVAPTLDINISEWVIGTDFTGRILPDSPMKSSGQWLESYIAMFEALTIPHPLVGRKPYVALRYGGRWWGVGRNACHVEEVRVVREDYHHGSLCLAKVSLRLVEVAIM